MARGPIDDPYDDHYFDFDLFMGPGKEAFTKLFNKEDSTLPENYRFDENKERLRKFALVIIETASKIGSNRCDARIPYTAMTYFDRCVSRYDDLPPVIESTEEENKHLFVICCLTLAWKVRGKSFVLATFLKDRKLEYSTQTVEQMESQICSRLEGRLRTPTPFSFIKFYIPILELPPNTPSPIRPVSELIVKSQFDIAYTQYRPSVIAASAVWAVSSEMFSLEQYIFAVWITEVECLKPLDDQIHQCKWKLYLVLKDNPSIIAPRDITIPINEPPAGDKPATTKAGTSRDASVSVEKQRSDPIPIPARPQFLGYSRSDPIRIPARPQLLGYFRSDPIPIPARPQFRGYFPHRLASLPFDHPFWRPSSPSTSHESQQELQDDDDDDVDDDDDDELMDFELGWIEATADDGSSTYFVHN